MGASVRFLSIELENFKNISQGKISFPKIKEEKRRGHNIIGVYGQNGSGKTVLVQAFEVLKRLSAGRVLEENLISHGEDFARLKLEFEIFDEVIYQTFYEIELMLDKEDKNKIKLKKETFTYRPILRRKRSQQIVYNPFASSVANMIQIINRNGDCVPFDNLSEDDVFEIKLAQHSGSSLLLSFENFGNKGFLDKRDFIGYKILYALGSKIRMNTIIISSQTNHHIYADETLPMQQASNVGDISFTGDLHLHYGKYPTLMQRWVFEFHQNAVESINIVLPQLIPGLMIELNEVGKETMPNGDKGIRAECLSIRNGEKIPFYYESTGIKKMVSILSALISLFNKEEIFVIIDELDTGIFEFLLGELLEILDKNAAGQLLFTSHNLRLLEVLEKENLVFTTTNPDNRFIQMKGLRETHNVRDRYIRAVQVGGQEEELYAETKAFRIKRAFRNAGAIKK